MSNRVPVPTGAPSAGGLAVALEAALKDRGGVWFGWSGEVSEQPGGVRTHTHGVVTYAVTDLTQKDLDEYYFGFANRALWPLCHYRLDLTGFASRDTAGYFRVNEQFARQLAAMIRPDDVIWVQDYHFIPLAAYLRQMGCENRIGFFHHIPWPPSDLATALPAYHAVMHGFSAYDLVGFQTPLDAENFAGCLLREGLGRAVGPGRYEAFERRFQVGAFPISIDVEAFRRQAEQAHRDALVHRTRASLEGKSLIIGVDRLDYSKGIQQRIEAFSTLLEKKPETRGKVTLIQITPKSRSEVPEYAKMQEEVAQQIGWTNGRFADLDWTPVRYINKAIGHAALAGLYRMARVGLVTPLRDGMNLVAKEYVAAQRPEDPGVLVLSRFAGAAHEFKAALLVNPHDTEATAAAIARALSMSLEERRERWSALMECLEANTIEHWTASFLDALIREPAGDRLDRFSVELESDSQSIAPGAGRGAKLPA